MAAQFVPYFPAHGQATSTASAALDAARIVRILCTTMRWFFWVLIFLSVIMILVAAFMYVTSGGDPERVGKATKTITYAVIGIAVALLASGVPSLVANFLDIKGNFDRC